MTPDCPDCGDPFDITNVGQSRAKCFDCNTEYEIGQCVGCGDRYAAEDMTVENVPGATLWFCPDCRTSRGIGRTEAGP